MEVDFDLASKWINSGVHASNSSASLIMDIKRLLGSLDHVLVEHVHRETNAVADSFARNGMNILDTVKLFNFVPSFALLPFFFDSCNTRHVRVWFWVLNSVDKKSAMHKISSFYLIKSRNLNLR